MLFVLTPRLSNSNGNYPANQQGSENHIKDLIRLQMPEVSSFELEVNQELQKQTFLGSHPNPNYVFNVKLHFDRDENIDAQRISRIFLVEGNFNVGGPSFNYEGNEECSVSAYSMR